MSQKCCPTPRIEWDASDGVLVCVLCGTVSAESGNRSLESSVVETGALRRPLASMVRGGVQLPSLSTRSPQQASPAFQALARGTAAALKLHTAEAAVAMCERFAEATVAPSEVGYLQTDADGPQLSADTVLGVRDDEDGCAALPLETQSGRISLVNATALKPRILLAAALLYSARERGLVVTHLQAARFLGIANPGAVLKMLSRLRRILRLPFLPSIQPCKLLTTGAAALLRHSVASLSRDKLVASAQFVLHLASAYSADSRLHATINTFDTDSLEQSQLSLPNTAHAAPVTAAALLIAYSAITQLAPSSTLKQRLCASLDACLSTTSKRVSDLASVIARCLNLVPWHKLDILGKVRPSPGRDREPSNSVDSEQMPSSWRPTMTQAPAKSTIIVAKPFYLNVGVVLNDLEKVLELDNEE
ncbi:hypothetical protein BC830DRAFT_1079729 [Chytriomyces sp. MP71]|nr:hypothetical protein BC830DRAFT_1079729 [Chytriomyces sp. MP71]